MRSAALERDGYVLVTGGAGFIGSNLADALLTAGERVVILDDFSRAGVEHNARWLRERHGERLRVERGDIRDRARVRALVARARQVYHLAAQVAVTTSVQDPMRDLETNLLGTFNVLEAARRAAQPPPILFSSTNKVYGDLGSAAVEVVDEAYRYRDGRRGVDEACPLDFYSPYGCSKGAADQYARDYARIYGLRTIVFRMSCIYGRRQFGTEDQGWVAHFARALLAGRPVTIYGDGCQVRDILFVDDLVEAMRLAMRRLDVTAGEIFNIGGGAQNAVSVRNVLERLAEMLDREPVVTRANWRPGDQRIYVSDASRAARAFGWAPTTPWTEGLRLLVAWLRQLEGRAAAAVPAFGVQKRLAARAAS